MEVDTPEPDELDGLVEQWVALADEQRDHGTHILAGANRATVRESLAHHLVAGNVLVARADPEGPPLGFVSMAISTGEYDTDATRGVVENLYVRPGHRGEGVGRRLLAAAERRLAEAGAEVVSLEAMAGNADARRFYERAGYGVHRVVYEKSVRDESDTKGD